MKSLFLVLVLCLASFAIVDGVEEKVHNKNSTTHINNHLVKVLNIAAAQGPLCSDGSRCDAKYNYCCDIRGIPTCVYKLSDCRE